MGSAAEAAIQGIRMSNVSFRLATSTDAPSLARLMTNLAKHIETVEKPDDDPSLRSVSAVDLEQRLAAAAADVGGQFQALVVEIENVICGAVFFTLTYDAIMGETCAIVRHIYVEEVVRRQKVGSHLMIQVAQLAKEQGWVRLEWQVERLDLEARVFFDKLSDDSFRLHRLNYALDRPHIEALAALLEN